MPLSNLEPSASQQYVSYNGRLFDSILREEGGAVTLTFSCKVDGKDLPDYKEYRYSMRTAPWRPDVVAVRSSVKGKLVVTDYLKWSAYELRLPIGIGTKAGRNDSDGLWRTEDYAGTWECSWKFRGKALRTFRWKVADGKFVPHPEQAAVLNLRPGSVFVETEVPSDNALDTALDASEVGAGFFGRPWASPEGKALGKVLKSRGTLQFPQPKNLDFGKPIKKWD